MPLAVWTRLEAAPRQATRNQLSQRGRPRSRSERRGLVGRKGWAYSTPSLTGVSSQKERPFSWQALGSPLASRFKRPGPRSPPAGCWPCGSLALCSPGCRQAHCQHESTVSRLQPGKRRLPADPQRPNPACGCGAGWSWAEPMGTSSCCCCDMGCSRRGWPAFWPGRSAAALFTEEETPTHRLVVEKLVGLGLGCDQILRAPCWRAKRKPRILPSRAAWPPAEKQTPELGTGRPIPSILLFAPGWGQPPLPAGGRALLVGP